MSRRACLKMAGKNMTEKQSISPQSIIDCLKANYGIAAALLTFLPLGADMNSSVYKAETQSSQSYFVKLKRGHRYNMSVAILALLQASGIQQIIPPVKTTNGWHVIKVDDIRAFVMPTFDQAKNTIAQTLIQQKRQEAVNALMQSTKISKGN